MFGPKTQKRILTATRQTEQNPLYASYLNEVMQHVDYIQDNNEVIGVIVGSETTPGSNGTHVYEATWLQYYFDTDEWLADEDTDTACYVIDVNGGELITGRRYICLRCAYDEANNLFYFVVDSGNTSPEGSTGYTAVNVVTKLCITREYNDEDPPVLLCVTDITYETRSILIPSELVGEVICGPYEDTGCCGIVTECCPDTLIPSRLRAVISNSTSSDIPDGSYTLTYVDDPDSPGWIWQPSESVYIFFECVEDSWVVHVSADSGICGDVVDTVDCEVPSWSAMSITCSIFYEMDILIEVI